MLKKKNFFSQRHVALITRPPKVLPLQKFLKHAKTDIKIRLYRGLGVAEKKILFLKMNKGNKIVQVLQTLFLISDPFSSILPKKVTSYQKFLPFLRFFTVYCTLHFNLKNTFKINVKKRQNGRNF